MAFLDPSAVAKLATLQLKARLIVEGALTGMHRARLHGSSIEFAEHKEYSPGDEIRHIDWKAYAKLDRYYVKQFEQESQLTAHLVLDGSGSMGYQGRGLGKLEYGSYLVSALAYLLLRQRDKVGLTVFGDTRYDTYIPPRARPAHLSDIFAVLEEIGSRGASGDEPVAAALSRVAELAGRRRSLIVVASDFLDATHERGLEILRQLRVQGHDPVLFHILDADELEFPFRGLTMFESLEDERKLLVSPEAVRREYMRRLDRFVKGAQRACVDSGVEYHLVSTAQPLERTLLDFLSLRSRLTTPRRAWSF